MVEMSFSSMKRTSKAKRDVHPRYVTWIRPDEDADGQDEGEAKTKEKFEDFRTVQTLCSPLFLLMKFTSINVDFKKSESESCSMKFYRNLLILMCLFNGAANVYGLYHFFKNKMDGNPTSVTNFVFLDHWVAMSILLNFSLKRRRIISVLRDIFQILGRMVREDKRLLRYKVRRLTLILSSVCLADLSFYVINIFFQIERINEEEFKSYYLDFYFGISSMPGRLGVILVIIASDVPYAIFMFCSSLFFCLIILMCSMLECCFQRLNSRELSVKLKQQQQQERTLRSYQSQHQVIAQLVVRINATFSPVILILIATKTAHIIAASDVIKSALKLAAKYPNTISSFVEKVAHICTSVGLIVTLTVKAGKLAQEAQKTFNVLLDTCLEDNEVNSGRVEMHKIHHLSTLFSAQRIISPITLTASDLFAINYNLLAVVISTTITYITLISESSTKCQN